MAKKRQELGATSVQVAKNVRRLRQGQGMSLDDLVKGTRGRLSRDSVKKIEAAANPEAVSVRRVDVDDLMVLAQALNTSPLALLLPVTDDPYEGVDITGSPEKAAVSAWAWGIGLRSLSAEVAGSGSTEEGRKRYQREALFRAYARPGWLFERVERKFHGGDWLPDDDTEHEPGEQPPDGTHT